MSDDLTPALQLLCEIDPPQVSSQWIDRHELRTSIESLISKGALVPSESVSSVLCSMCDDPHWVVPEHLGAGQYRGFCPINGYHTLPSRLLRSFVVSDAWIVDEIVASLGMGRKNWRSGEALPAGISVGRVRFGPYSCELFFGRRLSDRSRLEAAFAAVTEKAGQGPAILLTSTRKQFLSGPMAERCAVIDIDNVLTIGRGKTLMNEAPILAALRGPTPLPNDGGIGFRHSAGFRACAFGSEQFRFSDKQALAVEALHDAWRQGLPGLPQGELMGRVDTTQRISQLFHGHPAYGKLIRVDGNGFYRLNL
jgi:hypothetical protein